MKLLSLTVQNIFSIGSITIDIADRGLLLVTGFSEDEQDSNGSGKSSLANRAILWGLYGRSAEGLKGDSVANRHVPKESAFVEIKFVGVDGGEYVTRRSRRPNSLSLRRVDGIDLSQRKETDTQEILDRLLGRTFDTFVNTCVFGQEKEGWFAALSPTAQKQVLEEILPIGQLSEWAEKAKAAKKDSANSLALVESKTKAIEAGLNEVTTQRAMTITKSSAWERTKKVYIQEVEGKIANEEKLLERASEATSLIDQKLIELGAVAAEYDVTTKLLEEAEAAYDPNCSVGITEQLKVLRRELAGLKLPSRPVTVCPTCQQSLKQEEALAVYQQQLNLYNDHRGTIETAIKESEDIKQAVLELNEPIRKNIDRYKLTIKAATDALKNIAQLVTKKQEFQVEVIKDRIISLATERDNILDSINPHAASLEEMETRLAQLNEEIDTVKAEVSIKKTEVHAYGWWENAFSRDIKLSLLDKVGGYLSARTRHHLSGLANSQFDIRFNTVKRLASGELKEEFTIEVISKTGGESFAYLSKGEKQIVGFAINLALADLAELKAEGSANIMIMDEPLENLGSKNSEAVVEYLTKLQTRGTILLISNDDSLKNLIPNRIKLIKQGGITRMEAADGN